MTRLLPEELKEEYWERSEFEQDSIWRQVIAKGFRVSLDEARQRVEEIRKQPLRERLKSATILLAQASQGFIPYDTDGNRMSYRGPKPVLASDSNAIKLAGATYTKRAYWHTVHSQVCGDSFLIDQQLTAANPFDWPKGSGIEFSEQDVFTGTYVPPEIDAATAEALGIVQADGIVKKGFGLYLTGRTADVRFYQRRVPTIFAQAFNLIQEKPYLQEKESDSLSNVKTYRYKYPVASFYSKALTGYLQMLGFPTSREEARSKRVPKGIRDLPEELKEPFVLFYLGAKSHRNKNIGNYPYVDVLSESEAELEDIKQILEDLDVSGSMSINKQAHSYLLHLGSGAVDKMWKRGLFDANPYLIEELKPLFKTRGHNYKPRIKYR